MADKTSLRPKSDIQSGTERDEVVKLSGGLPPKKSVEQIDSENSPKGRGRAPGSVRV